MLLRLKYWNNRPINPDGPLGSRMLAAYFDDPKVKAIHASPINSPLRDPVCPCGCYVTCDCGIECFIDEEAMDRIAAQVAAL